MRKSVSEICSTSGLAVGAIGTAIASVITGFLSLTWWEMPLSIVGLILIISEPSVLLAYLKSINTRAIINIPFGTSLTKTAALPPGAQRSLSDPYAEKKVPWKSYLFILLLAGGLIYLWQAGYINENTVNQLRDRITGVTMEQPAPAAKPAVESEKNGVTGEKTVTPVASPDTAIPAIKPVNIK